MRMIALLQASLAVASASTCEALSRAAVAFVGTVTTGSESDPDAPPRLGNRIASVRVQDIIHGLPDGPREVRIDPLIGSSFYLRLHAGTRWLFIGDLDPRDKTVIVTGSTSGSHELSQASSGYLKTLIDSYLKGPNLVIGHASSIGTNLRWMDNPVAGAEITLTGKDAKWSGRTNAEGRFEARGLPPGEYQFRVSKEGMLTERHAGSGFPEGRVPDKITIPPRGCVEAPVYLWPETRLSGVVTSAGEHPINGAKVTAFRIDNEGAHRATRSTVTGGGGRYEFERLIPGRYVIGINADRGMDEEYATTYHPSSPTRAGATHVTVIDGKTVNEVNIRAPLPRRFVTMRVRVLWPDDRPAAGAFATLEHPDNGDIHRNIEITDAQGFATIGVYDGAEYEIRADWALWEQSEKHRPLSWHRAPALVFVGSPGRTVVLRLNEKSE
jgi:hypothetical protein